MTLQLPALRVHDVLLNEPAPLLEKLTAPIGVTAPAPEESVTVAVQVVWLRTVTDDGEHATEVEDVRIFEVTMNVPLLPVWTLSPP